LFPKAGPAPASFANCSTCLNHTNKICELQADMLGALEEEDRRALESKIAKEKSVIQEHLDEAFNERKLYKTQVTELREMEDPTTLMISLDFKRGMTYPVIRHSTQEMYFSKRPFSKVFGIV